MRKATKILLITSLCLIAAGVLLCCASLAMGYSGGFGITGDFSYRDFNDAPSMEKLELGPFTGIELSVEACDVELAAGDRYALEYEGLTAAPDFSVGGDGVLRFTTAADKENYILLLNGLSLSVGNINGGLGTVRIYCPANAALNGVSIDNSVGDVDISGINCGDITVKADSGGINIQWLTAGNVTVENDAGDVRADSLNVGGFTLDSDYGDIDIVGLNAGTVTVSSGYGDTELRNFTVTEKADITSDYGDVKLFLRDGGDGYGLDLRTDFGDVTVNGKNYGSSSAGMYAPTGIPIRVYTAYGDIEAE